MAKGKGPGRLRAQAASDKWPCVTLAIHPWLRPKATSAAGTDGGGIRWPG